MAETKLRRALATAANHHEWAVGRLEHRVRTLAPLRSDRGRRDGASVVII